ncbi:MAG: 1,4-alpha-glucan branching protein GlgB, partial [Candidatus Omnitrophica bacterium]|nr:1,4-alpha-glucan branching protein GlgB [Candidatus Omnitrophota bacterium]
LEREPMSVYEVHLGSWRRRSEKPLEREPMSVYEVHLGSWRRRIETGGSFLSYRRLADELVAYVKEMGYTHIELMPVAEHPLDESWGYQVTNYYAPTSRFGEAKDFMYFVDVCHQNGIGVFIDWVPAHFPKDMHGLANFDGKEIYAYESWRKREHKDWGTFVFDYGRPEVSNFLMANALFWLDKYHIDGLRVDAVASMLYLDYSRRPGEWEANRYGGNTNLEAVDFIKKFNTKVRERHPGAVTIAEESTAWGGVSRPIESGGLGFNFKWNMGWMNDTLRYFSKNPIHRCHHQGELTFSMLYAFTENFVLSLSHDEVVHGKRSLIDKMPGDEWQATANLRLLYSYMFAHPGKKLLYMGQDFAQGREWNCTRSLEWELLKFDRHAQIQKLYKDLNHLYQKEPALYQVDFESAGFEWIDFSDYQASVLSFVRWSQDYKELIVAVCNMTPVPRKDYRIGVPRPGKYRVLFDSDAAKYGGSGFSNTGVIETESMAWHHRTVSMKVNFPPLGLVLYKHEPGAVEAGAAEPTV